MKMPVDMSKYPDDWNETRDRILRRAGGGVIDPNDARVGARCEKCGVTNYELVYIDEFTGERTWLNHENGFDCNLSFSEAQAQKQWMEGDGEPFYSIVVLTIAHVHDSDPMNCDDENLAAWCQKCHNAHDAPMRRKNAAETRRQNKIENGQLELKMEI